MWLAEWAGASGGAQLSTADCCRRCRHAACCKHCRTAALPSSALPSPHGQDMEAQGSTITLA